MEDLLKKYGMNAGAKPSVYENAKILRERMTKEETILWDYLLTNPFGVRFRRQHPFGEYVLDFYCHEKRLSVELDGQYHNENDQKILDQKRTEFINSMGVKEVRFWNNDINNSFIDSMQKLKLIIDERPSF